MMRMQPGAEGPGSLEGRVAIVTVRVATFIELSPWARCTAKCWMLTDCPTVTRNLWGEWIASHQSSHVVSGQAGIRTQAGLTPSVGTESSVIQSPAVSVSSTGPHCRVR